LDPTPYTLRYELSLTSAAAKRSREDAGMDADDEGAGGGGRGGDN
jgi:hypothetical protein